MHTTQSSATRLFLDVDLAKLKCRAADFGFRLATFQEMNAAMEMAEGLVDVELASASAILEMDRITGMTAWVTGDPVDGVFLPIPLSEAGEAALLNGTYSVATPNPAHLAPQGQHTAAFYTGFYAGSTKEARRKIMMAAATFRMEMFGSVPSYARAATADGKRSMISLGFKPVEGGLPDLYRQEPIATQT